jgi:hypothetical protein
MLQSTTVFRLENYMEVIFSRGRSCRAKIGILELIRRRLG